MVFEPMVMHSDEAIKAEIQRLLRGATQPSQDDMYQAHRALYLMGQAAIPELRNSVLGHDFRKVDFPERTVMVSALVGVIHDIDETVSRQIVEQIKKKGCHPTIRSALDSVCRFNADEYARYDVLGIPVFESKKIGVEQRIAFYLARWLRNVPASHIEDIERLYAVPYEEGLEYHGYYVPGLTAVTLVWENSFGRRNPLGFLDRFLIERTLYHEIGHHFHRHESGQDSEQERQADQYATGILMRAHPILFRTIRPLLLGMLWPVKLIFRAKRGDSQVSTDHETYRSNSTKY